MFALKLLLPVALMAASYQPEVLSGVLERSRQSQEQAAESVVVFDLDDTLIDTRHRTLSILRELAAEPWLAARFPKEAPRLARVTLNQMHYELNDTFAELGLDSPDLLRETTAFWAKRFFTSAYVERDVALPGAVRYVNDLYRAGAKIVYLTGRDEPNMFAGTGENLRRLGFPLEEDVALILKPNARMSDLEFKAAAIKRIAGLGQVTAFFENEPANLNLMREGFAGATGVFIDTQHSPKPDRPYPGAAWVKDFGSR